MHKVRLNALLDVKLWLSNEKISVINALGQGFSALNECLWDKVMVI